MKQKKVKKKEDWELAHTQASKMGIVLTRRKNSDGNYVCYLGKKARRGWLGLL